MNDFGQPRIRYTVIRDFSESKGHRHKVVFVILGKDGNPLAKFNVCECVWQGLADNITKNLERVRGTEKECRNINIPEKLSEKDVRYIG